MGGWVSGWWMVMDGCTYGWMDRQVDGSGYEWIGDWMGKDMDGQLFANSMMLLQLIAFNAINYCRKNVQVKTVTQKSTDILSKPCIGYLVGRMSVFDVNTFC